MRLARPERLGGLVRALALAGLAAVTSAWAACGGGSGSDIVLPEDVDVTLEPLAAPGAHDVGLVLGGKSGREVMLQVVGTGLESATGVAFELQYDTALLEFVDAEPSGFFGAGSVGDAGLVEGADQLLVGVAAAGDQTAGRDGGGTLLTLRFRLRQLRDAQADLIFGIPQSQVYGPAGVAGQHAFTGARLVTRIRAPL